MSQQNGGFVSGFFLGALLGGVVGGTVGVLLTSRRLDEEPEDGHEDDPGELRDPADSIESTRRSLETKIAQLNLAIDDVRQQLGTVNGSSQPDT